MEYPDREKKERGTDDGLPETDCAHHCDTEPGLAEQPRKASAACGTFLHLAGGEFLGHAACEFLEDLPGLAFHAFHGTGPRVSVQMPPARNTAPPPRVDRLPTPATVDPVRRHSALLSLMAVTALLPGCTTERVVVIERSAAPAAAVVPEVPFPAARLRVALQRFLAAAVTGAPTDLLLAGDRFMVVTPVDLVEVASLRARGDVRAIAIGVPGDCAGECRALLGDVFAALQEDMASPSASPEVVVAEAPLESWPTLEVVSAERRWWVSFDEAGRGVFVVELLSGSVGS